MKLIICIILLVTILISVQSCIGEFALAGKTYGVYFVFAGMCTTLVAETSTDVVEAACSNSEMVCGTLKKTDARYRGCFPTDPTVDTYYYESTCDFLLDWTSAYCSATNNGNTVDAASCYVGNNINGVTLYHLDGSGNCNAITEAIPTVPNVEIKPTQCTAGMHYCGSVKSKDGDYWNYFCDDQYTPTYKTNFFFDSKCMNFGMYENCFGYNCNNPSGSYGRFLNFLLCFCFCCLPGVCYLGYVGILAYCIRRYGDKED
eukprot:Mrub_07739.p1 GENE.Mrub_07739~~Mrub_07739.p1  ORF type:complete len:259 (+),score=20.59 Mrub_07739:60-836(+)